MKKIWILSLFMFLLLAGCNKNVEPKESLTNTWDSPTVKPIETWNYINSTVEKLKEETKKILKIDEHKRTEIIWPIYENKRWMFSLNLNPNRIFQENIWNALVILSPEWLSGVSKANLSISQLELPNPDKKISLEDYYSQNKLSIRDAITDFTELSQKKTKIDWKSALEVIYNWEQNGQNFQVKQVFFQSSNNIFIITYLASQDVFSDYLSEVDTIINSIKLK